MDTAGATCISTRGEAEPSVPEIWISLSCNFRAFETSLFWQPEYYIPVKQEIRFYKNILWPRPGDLHWHIWWPLVLNSCLTPKKCSKLIHPLIHFLGIDFCLFYHLQKPWLSDGTIISIISHILKYSENTQRPCWIEFNNRGKLMRVSVKISMKNSPRLSSYTRKLEVSSRSQLLNVLQWSN
jgi:hypothetical protein